MLIKIDGNVVASILRIELARGIVFCEIEESVEITDLLDDSKFLKAMKKFLKPFGISLLDGYSFYIRSSEEIGFVAKEKNKNMMLDFTLETDLDVCIGADSEIFNMYGERSFLKNDRWVRLKAISPDFRRVYWRGHRTEYSTNLENVQ